MITISSQSILGHESKHIRENSNTLLAKKRNNSGDSLGGKKIQAVEAIDPDGGKNGAGKMWHYITGILLSV